MFLKLKKEHHIDKPLRVKFVEAPVTCKVETKTYEDNTFNTFSLKVKNIGPKFYTEGEGSFSINNGQEFELKSSEALYKQVTRYEPNNAVEIKMKKVEDPKNRAGFVWDVKPLSHSNIEKTENVNSNDLNIKWGMAFNNTTRLISSIPLHSDETPQDRVKLIKELTPKMFEIACSMPEPKKEEVKKDDLPF